ncbi:MAG TPA: c-type cytochrome [Candidatus Angelobacter sp.]|nr:c-type cytochrome [Candidatus Angelobacter sp.]
MTNREFNRPKTQNLVFRLASRRYLAHIMVVLVIIAISTLAWLSSSQVFAAQNNNAAGDPSHGREVFEKRCAGCHALDREKEGPRLRGVFGRKSGSITSFKYSDAVKSANVIWDASSLDQWLTDPDKFIPDSDMDFRLGNSGERSDVIAYLKQLSNQ